MEQKAFDDIKRAISQDTLLAYPNSIERFDIYTYASDYQLGAVVIQDSKPIAFYICKLTRLQ